MNILMLSDVELTGGASVSASRLASSLSQAGHRVTRVVAESERKDHVWKTYEVRLPHSLGWRVARKLLPDDWKQPVISRKIERTLEKILENVQPDVINIHNLHGAVTSGWGVNLAQLCSRFAPTVWTLHDMWSFTGRCAYSYDCRKFLTGCDSSCPTPDEYPALRADRIADAWESRKQTLASVRNIVAVTPSRWLQREAKAGLWADHQVEVIPNGSPLDVYEVMNRQTARKALGIPDDDPVVLITAVDLSDRRKGLSVFLDAIRALGSPLTLLTLGHGKISVNAENITHCSLGYVDHERTRALAYNAATLFAHPALADNLPNVAIESIACGTPVVGFPVGGVPEIVRNGKTGWLAEELTANALAEILRVALKYSGDDSIRSSCRAIAEAEYDIKLQSKRYLTLFNQMIEGSKNNRLRI